VNFKKFGVFIVVVGFLVAAYAGYELYQVENGLQREINSYANSSDRWGTALFAIPMIKSNASAAKKEPMKILGLGGLIVFIGIGIAAAAKKQKQDKEFPGATIVGKFL